MSQMDGFIATFLPDDQLQPSAPLVGQTYDSNLDASGIFDPVADLFRKAEEHGVTSDLTELDAAWDEVVSADFPPQEVVDKSKASSGPGLIKFFARKDADGEWADGYDHEGRLVKVRAIWAA
jgi:hypothetical protein